MYVALFTDARWHAIMAGSFTFLSFFFSFLEMKLGRVDCNRICFIRRFGS